MDKPTNDQIAEMAEAACFAATAKAKELGLDWIYFAVGIERAYNATIKTLKIIDVLGPNLSALLGECVKASFEQYTNEKEQ